MYPRWLYVCLLALATTSTQFAAVFGTDLHYYAAFVVAFALGAIVFYQGEARAVAGPIVSNFAIGVALGTAGTVVFTGALVVWLLNVPWDLALWRAGLLTWDLSLAVDFTLVTSFFLVGVVDAMN